MVGKCKNSEINRFMLPSERLRLLKEALANADAKYLAASEADDAARASGASNPSTKSARAEARANRRNLQRRLATEETTFTGDMPVELSRLMAKTIDCIEWTGNRNENNYGTIYFQGTLRLAHRVSYVFANSLTLAEIRGVLIRHQCDNPGCVNPNHLLRGTQADNVRDMHERGREGHGGARGSSNAGAKITEETVLEVRRRLDAGELQKSIAGGLGLSVSAIHKIKARKTWSHI